MNLDHQDDMDHTLQQFADYLVNEIALKARQRSTYVSNSKPHRLDSMVPKILKHSQLLRFYYIQA